MFVTDPIAIKGESEAAKILESKGFRIVEHNWRMGHLEVDLIAESKDTIVFAEVKARTSMFGNIRPEEYVDESKKHRMIAAANAYVKRRQLDKPIRFDIIGMVVHPKTEAILYCNHLEGAFTPSLKTISAGSFNGSWKWQHRTRSIRR